MQASELLSRLRRLATARSWIMTERQGRGSHLVIRLNGRTTVVPVHRGDMPAGTYRAILRQLGLTSDDMEV